MSDITQILASIEQGDPHAADELLLLVYDELRRLASQRIAQEQPGQTLQATALVHEAYLRLIGTSPDTQWDGRGHFFAAAAEAMRRILVERARHKMRLRHGGDHRRVEIADLPAQEEDRQLVALDEALTQLVAEDPQTAQVVVIKHFGGLTHEQIADALGLSVYQVRQRWNYGRAWLRSALEG